MLTIAGTAPEWKRFRLPTVKEGLGRTTFSVHHSILAQHDRYGQRQHTSASRALVYNMLKGQGEMCKEGRCARLKKECQSKEPILKRKKPIKTTRAAQLEKLESKIEHLVHALASTPQVARATNEYGQPSPPISQVSTSQSFATDKGISRQSEVLNAMCHEEPLQDTTETPGGSRKVASPATLALNSEARSTAVTLNEAEVLLDRFRRLMSPGLPYVVLPEGVKARELYKVKPVLLRAITTVAMFHDLSRQQILVRELIRDVSERIMINGEKSIDLLQAIMVFVAWFHAHVFWCQQVTNLLHLAIALTIDMGIDRQPQLCGGFKTQTTKAVHGNNLATRMPTLEEHRVLVGLFYLSSMLSSSFKKVDAMPLTRHMRDCLAGLEAAREHDTDIFLVQMVRIQHIVETIHTTDCPTVPAKIYTKAYQADLERLRRMDPCKEDNLFLQMQYLTAEILMWELSLIELQEDRSKSLSSVLDDLYRCVAAIKAFLDVYFAIPSSAYYLLPFSVFGQFAHAFIVLTKLASLEVEGWDLKVLSEQLSFSEVIEESAVRFEESTKSAPDGIRVNNDSFGKWAQRIRWMKQVYESKFNEQHPDAGAGAPESARQSRQPDDLGQRTPPDDVLNTDFFNYLDENFWDSFAGEFDLGFPAHSLAVV
ncbi:hypothetical protein AC578_2120 [Pseudocercospora eumusae]|uniref:Transcription factor domain-containing protein n=1 Tax=Pseudocercospora eumusae TaxID=321146 RepID=A0A139HQC1_9PEZI|nr:hypothetical protein AC578_2120 [Pseudocercospora eumusae]